MPHTPEVLAKTNEVILRRLLTITIWHWRSTKSALCRPVWIGGSRSGLRSWTNRIWIIIWQWTDPGWTRILTVCWAIAVRLVMGGMSGSVERISGDIRRLELRSTTRHSLRIKILWSPIPIAANWLVWAGIRRSWGPITTLPSWAPLSTPALAQASWTTLESQCKAACSNHQNV